MRRCTNYSSSGTNCWIATIATSSHMQCVCILSKSTRWLQAGQDSGCCFHLVRSSSQNFRLTYRVQMQCSCNSGHSRFLLWTYKHEYGPDFLSEDLLQLSMDSIVKAQSHPFVKLSGGSRDVG